MYIINATHIIAYLNTPQTGKQLMIELKNKAIIV